MFPQPIAIPEGAQVQILDPTTPWSVSLYIRRPLSPDGLSVSDHAAGIRAGTHRVLSREEFANIFSSDQADHDLVDNYAQQIGATVDLSHTTAAVVTLLGTVGIFNSMFSVELHTVTTDERTYASYFGTARLPAELTDVVVNVSGLDYSHEPYPRSLIRAVTTTTDTPTSIFGSYTTPVGSPQAAATAYNFPGRNDGTDGIGQVVGLIEPFGSCGYTQQNLNSTFGGFGLTVPNIVEYLYSNNPFFNVINDPSQGASAEVMLDIAAVGGIVPKATTVVYITDNLLNAMSASLYDIKNLGYFPSVLSFSFAATLPHYGSTFNEATAMGVTLVVASGDWGVYNQPSGWAGRAVDVAYPAASADVLAVGGTSLAINPDGTRASEVAWNDGYDYAISGGGQSTMEPVPSWQSGLTLKNYGTGAVTALTGRGTPDVAFNADGNTGFPVYYDYTNKGFSANGTSSAAPHWAGLIARMNEAAGGRLGFITNILYQHPEAFNDITVGDNNESGVGYSTTVGWDAVTGLGTPKGNVLYNILVNEFGDATLSGLSLSAGTLSPSFSSSIASYTVSESAGVNSVTVTPTANNANATITVNGTSVTSGTASGSISLSGGANTITVVVTAPNGSTTKTYTITVTAPKTINTILNISYGNDPLQFVNAYAPASGPVYGTLLHIHGGGWTSADGGGFDFPSSTTTSAYMETLAQAGWAVIDVNYRDKTSGGGLTSSGGLAGDIQDIMTVLSYCLDSTAAAGAPGTTWPSVNSYIAAHGGLIVYGTSAGGHLTMMGVCEYGTVNGKWPLAAISFAGPMNLDYNSTVNYTDPWVATNYVDNYIQTLSQSDRQRNSPFYQYGTDITDSGVYQSIPGPGRWFTAVNNSSCKFYFIQNENDTLVPLSMIAPTVVSFQTWNGSNTFVERLYQGPSREGWDGRSAVTIKGTLSSTSQLPSSGQTLGDAYSINGSLWVYNGGTYAGYDGSSTNDLTLSASVNGFTLWFQHNYTNSEQNLILDFANRVTGSLTVANGVLNGTCILSAGTVGSSYSYSVNAAGGASPYTYKLTQGVFPAGVSINASSGVISGTPTEPGLFHFKIIAQDISGAVVSQTYRLRISSASATSPVSSTFPITNPDSIFSGLVYPRGPWHTQYFIGVGPAIFNGNIANSTGIDPDYSATHVYVVDEIDWANGDFKPTGSDLQALSDYWRNRGISPGVGITHAAEAGYAGHTPVPQSTVRADALTVDWIALDPYLYIASVAYFNGGSTTINSTTVNNAIQGLLSWTETWINFAKANNRPVVLITQGIREGGLPLTYVNQYLQAQYSTFPSQYTVAARLVFPYEVLEGIEKYTLWPVDVSSFVSSYPFASSDASLSNLSISPGTLDQSFDSNNLFYSASVASNISSITVTPTATSGQATITVNGTLVSSGSASGAISLSVGSNTITIIVTAQDGVTTTYYTLTVTRAAPVLSSDATLSSLTISSGSLSPSFSSGTTSYTDSVANSVSSVTVVPTVHESHASVTVNGTPVTSGSASGSISLGVGSNTITVVVTAQDSSTKTYTITVTRAPSTDATLSSLTVSSGTLSPSFSSATTSYTDSVVNSVSSVTVTPTVNQADATVTVNGNSVTSGTASGSINLSVGSNTITVVVTAQSGATKTYTITVSRASVSLSSDATLSALAISSGSLSPSFSSGTTSYTDSVANGVGSVTVTPTVNESHATVTVNGTTVNSGSPSGSISLSVGSNTITVLVTAQDSSTKTYTITVTRAAATLSSDATLSALTVSSGSLSPSFSSATTSYTDSVANSVGSITVTPTVNESHATVTVNGNAVTSGSASGSINLNVGSNTITVVVTAQDSSTKTYTITVTRAAIVLSNDDTLSSLTISSGTLTPSFTFGTTSYLAYVSNGVSSVTVTPTANESHATIKVNGTPVTSGSPSGSISLSVGANTITIVVTAQNGATNTYTITVNRSSPVLSSDATLANLTISSGILSPTFSSGTTSYTASVGNNTTSVTVTPTVNNGYATVTVNGTIVDYGYPSSGISLVVGSNTITVVVTAQDSTTKTYTIVVTRAQSSDATLSGLTISSGTLVPGFASSTLLYTDSVSNSVGSVTVTPTANESHATITVNGSGVSSGTASGSINLSVGSNTITVTVTSQDSSTTNHYVITVTRASPGLSSDSRLLNLTVSAGSLSPSFASGTTSYTNSVGNNISSLTITPTTNESHATITVNGTPVTSGHDSGSILLAVGNNTITIVVTAQDSTIRTYTIVVTRARSSDSKLSALSLSAGTLSPTFTSATVNYAATVAYGVTDITVTATLDDSMATFTVNGSTGSSGVASSAVHLLVGTNNITVVVTSPDSSTSTTYTIVVTRNAPGALSDYTLSALQISSGFLTPVFNATHYSYSAIVSNTVSSISLTPTANQPGSVIAVNGYPTVSGHASQGLSLVTGTNTCRVVVTAPDNIDIGTYTVTVVRSGPVALEFLQNTNLGSVRDQTQQILDVRVYDPQAGSGTIAYSSNTLPGNLSLDTTTGYIYGKVSTAPGVYTFEITAAKTQSGNVVGSASAVFTLTVTDSSFSRITWATSSTLGTVYTGEACDLSVVAKITPAETSALQYSVVSGSLPTGLTLTQNGYIVGNPAYTAAGSYEFTVLVRDSGNTVYNQRTFTLQVLARTGLRYTNIYMRPFLARAQRQLYNNFINNTSIFLPELLYRPGDPNFGLVSDLKIYLEIGLEQTDLDRYAQALTASFKKRYMVFGSATVAQAKDASGNRIYEAVYIPVVDNNITAMRTALESITTGTNHRTLAVNVYDTPLYMRTPQGSSYNNLGYLPVVPLCYALPGQGVRILDRIVRSGFQFNQLDFEVDRMIVEMTADKSGPQSLIFPNR